MIVAILGFALFWLLHLLPYKFSSHTSDIVIDKRKGIVIKRVRRFIDKDVYEREVYILQLLNSSGFDWCPRLLGTDPSSRSLTMSYCGERLTRRNQPADAKEQFARILSDMRSIGMRHNDIKASEVLVDRRGRLRLCDFGWATLDGSLSCGIGLWDGKKPHGSVEDDFFINRITK